MESAITFYVKIVLISVVGGALGGIVGFAGTNALIRLLGG